MLNCSWSLFVTATVGLKRVCEAVTFFTVGLELLSKACRVAVYCMTSPWSS